VTTPALARAAERAPAGRWRTVPGLGSVRLAPSCAVAGPAGPASVLDALAGGRTEVLAVTVDGGGRVLELPVPSQRALHRCLAGPAAAGLDEATVRALRTLVLDGVLELQGRRPPRTGPGTWARLCDRPTGAGDGGGALHRLSVDAVRHGAAFVALEPAQLTARLYFFNRRPATPAWRYRLPTVATVQGFLGLDRAMATPAMREAWRRASRNDPRETGWVFFRSTRRRRAGAPRYKVYASPGIDRVPDLVARLPDLLDDEVVDAFKVGAHLYALLRPDKFVLYCSSLDAVHAVGRRLVDGLAGMEAHGVPFTAPLAADGLVSWGADPPPGYHAGSTRERNSWRLWVASLLADALAGAAATPGLGLPPPDYAMLRLAEDGVGLPGWEPPPAFTAAAADGE
jgi:hypothetical protein